MSELSRRMRNKCNITSTAVAPQVKWRWIFKCASSGLGENAFQHRWKFTIGIIFYVPNTSLPQNSPSSGQWKTCKYYVKNAKKTPYLNDWYCGSQFVAQQLSCINILCPVPCTMSIPYLFRGVQAWEYYYSILIYPTQLWTRVSKGRGVLVWYSREFGLCTPRRGTHRPWAVSERRLLLSCQKATWTHQK